MLIIESSESSDDDDESVDEVRTTSTAVARALTPEPKRCRCTKKHTSGWPAGWWRPKPLILSLFECSTLPGSIPVPYWVGFEAPGSVPISAEDFYDADDE